MYASKLMLEFLPNVHLLAVFIIALTVVYKAKALYPIYVFIFLTGLFNGFSMWWLPYLYIWLFLWFPTMLLPKKINTRTLPIIYMILGGLHGYLYGTLYAPAQALMFHLNFKQTIAWIIAGLPYDFIHGTSNFFCCILVVPLIKALQIAEKSLSK